MIKIENLSFTYPDGTLALDGVSFEIQDGMSIGIIGANGAGKTTLVNHLNAYCLPQSGKVIVNGIESSKENSEKLRKEVGLVFQNPDDQLFMPQLIEDVLFGPMNLGMEKDAAMLEAESVMRELDIWRLRMKPPFNLSQGQKRFAAFATVLVMKPSVLVVDEPTSDLDPRNRRKLIRLMKNLKSTRIIVSHDLDFVWDTCARVVIISSGKPVAEGGTKEILSDKNLLETNGLELPIRLAN
ncbi:MAG TPA: cobalt ABC transporter ATP-binding protein [Lentisphaeria bacterium]|nr:MAG: cobalt ABC transporter ATP-binding protein [Lentisphaerae bacterium GWF2_49_21]HBC89144.1 cobalt ABC transporter ATP-binding protein [Lentisphaeria bacterium]